VVALRERESSGEVIAVGIVTTSPAKIVREYARSQIVVVEQRKKAVGGTAKANRVVTGRSKTLKDISTPREQSARSFASARSSLCLHPVEEHSGSWIVPNPRFGMGRVQFDNGPSASGVRCLPTERVGGWPAVELAPHWAKTSTRV